MSVTDVTKIQKTVIRAPQGKIFSADTMAMMGMGGGMAGSDWESLLNGIDLSQAQAMLESDIDLHQFAADFGIDLDNFDISDINNMDMSQIERILNSFMYAYGR
jgi:hypothetical protein